MRLGVDIGGTFTDVALDTGAALHTAKVTLIEPSRSYQKRTSPGWLGWQKRTSGSFDKTIKTATGTTGFMLGGYRANNLLNSVNFSLDVLLMPAALERLEEQRAAAGVAANRIIVELTESQPVDDIPGLRRSLDYLRALGYGVAIDDVGPAVPQLAAGTEP